MDVSAYARAHSKVNHLSLVDPKALQYILHTSGYHFPKVREDTQSTKLIIGQGVLVAHGPQIFWLPAYFPGTTHQRQRKIITPAFFAPQLRTFLPLFQDMASKVRCLVDTHTTQK